MKVFRKIGALILALVMLFTSFPADISYAAKVKDRSGTFRELHKLKDANGKAYSYSPKEMSFFEMYLLNYNTQSIGRWSIQEKEYLTEYRVLKGNEYITAYCVEHGVREAPSTDKLTAWYNEVEEDNAAGNKNFVKRIYEKYKKQHILKNISLCTYYGKLDTGDISTLTDDLGFKDSIYYQKNAKRYTMDDWEAATRQLIHETQQEFRDKNFNLVQNGLYYNVGQWGRRNGLISKLHYQDPLKGRAAYDIYKHMEMLIQKHYSYEEKLGTQDYYKPKPMKLTDEDGNNVWEKTIPVIKSKAFEFEAFERKNKEWKPSKNLKVELLNVNGKYEYKITYTGDLDKETTFKLKKKAHRRDCKDVNDLIYWELKDGSGHRQPVVTGHADPLELFIKLGNEEKPTIEKKRPKPEYFPTFEFKVEKKDKNPGFDGNDKTPMGDAELNATYVLLKDGAEVDRVTLDTYGSVASLSDEPWSEAEEFTETESGSRDHIVDKKVHCTVNPIKLTWTASVNYEIKEIRPDGRFIEPDTGYRRYRVDYYGESNDSRNCESEPESWSEIEYDVKWTVTDGDTGSLNEGVGKGNIGSVSDILTFGTQVYINDNYRGKITLSKSLESENVFEPDKSSGVQKDSTKSLWKMRLNSGGFENHPYIRYTKEKALPDGTAVYRVTRDNGGASSEEEPMKIGTNGDLLILDIPYGSYTVEEASADDESYTLESFIVDIGEHNKAYDVSGTNDDRYDYNIRNKKKTNVIKVVKTNAETGKTVFSNETKFYIRYKGNQLITDPKLSKNCERFLPNAESITKDGPYTFNANSNGEIVIPYEIPYGTYELMEWQLPEGYYVGEYKGKGEAVSKNYGLISENQTKALLSSSYTDTVGIFDHDGKSVKYKDKDKYKINEIFNLYTFKVEKQNMHIDGNPSHKVTQDGEISKTDEAYDKDDYPYEGYYKAVSMTNNNAKGRIIIKKMGEILSGFKKVKEKGKEVIKFLYEKEKALENAIFGIFSDEDVELNDGNLGGDFYDSISGKKIEIPVDKITHEGNPEEDIKGLDEYSYRAGVYASGGLELLTGENLWFISDRQKSEANKLIRMYVTSEKENTKYTYTLSKSDDIYDYTYDIEVDTVYTSNGKAKIDIKAIKTTNKKDGFTDNILTTTPSAKVGDKVLNPIENYLQITDIASHEKKSRLTTSLETDTYEIDGKISKDVFGNQVDFSDIGAKREIKKIYISDKLTTSDLAKEEREVKPGLDSNGDGDFDDEGDTKPVKETKTKFEWETGEKLVEGLKVGDFKIVEGENNSYKVHTLGYYRGEEKKLEKAFVLSDKEGKVIYSYKIPEGYRELDFTGKPGADDNYIIATNGAEYITLLDNGSFTKSTEKGNFEKKKVEVFSTNFYMEPKNPIDFSYEFDSFKLKSKLEEGVFNITLEKPEGANSNLTLGAGYIEETKNNVTKLKTEGEKPSIYYMSKDGIKTEVMYLGNSLKTNIYVKQDMVSKNFKEVLPKIEYLRKEKSGEERYILDWYKKLSPKNPILESDITDEVSFTSKRIESPKTGEVEGYEIEVISEAPGNEPIVITYPDGYTAYIYKGKGKSGKDAGVILISGLKKTMRFSKSALVEIIKTNDKGEAVSSLLPLGKYYVKELEAPSEYIRDEEAKRVELKYKDQFTPLITSNLEFKNKLYNVEIDLEKGFETGFNKDTYVKGNGANFGIFNRDEILVGDKKVKEGSLLSVFTPDENGKALVKEKLPSGVYFVKELSTREGYTLLPYRLFFTLGDKLSAGSPKISYIPDGISGEITMMSFGKAEIDLSVQNRYPMGNISISGENLTLGSSIKDKNYEISVDKAETRVNIKLKDNEETDIMLPNGKRLFVKVIGNVIKYILDGAEKEYVQETSFTGTYSEYTKEFKKTKGESLLEVKESFTFKGAGESSSEATFNITHTPKVKKVESWKDVNGNGVKEPEEISTKETGILDTEGNQVYDHKAAILLLGIETEIPLNERKDLSDGLGGTFTYILDKGGNLEVSHTNVIQGKVEEKDKPSVSGIGTDLSKLIYMENVTGVRTNTKTDSVQVKINKGKENDVEILKNRVKDEKIIIPPTPPTPSVPNEPDKPSIGTRAADIKTGTNISKAEKKATFIDYVKYTNLVIGKSYKVVGTLMDKATGKELLVNGKPVTAENTFTAEKRDGVVEVIFTLDSRSLEGKTTVVFERLYQDNIEVASHTDITDEEQTVYIIEEEKPEEEYGVSEEFEEEEEEDGSSVTVPKTGVETLDSMYWLLCIASLIGIICNRKLRRIKNEQ